MRDRTELLLTREAALAAVSIGNGLTQVSRYNYAEVGYFYSGIFSYCIGLERVLKLILIDEHRLQHDGAFPSNEELKSHGHRLSDLIDLAVSISDRHGLGVDSSDLHDDIIKSIVVFLTDFAVGARYYNLDCLTGHDQGNDEPLVRWQKEVCAKLLIRHFNPTLNRQFILPLAHPSFLVRHTSDDGTPMNDMGSMIEEGTQIRAKQAYSRLYLYRIARFAVEVQRELEFKGGFVPHLHEFFCLFTSRDHKWILRKKIWDRLF